MCQNDFSDNFPNIVEMFELQKRLNDETNGQGWEGGINKFGKSIDWLRCISMECSELIDSTPWKHWKNIDAEVDWDNVQVELVDIWHFLMSELLRNYSSYKCVGLTDEIWCKSAETRLDVKRLIDSVEMMAYVALKIKKDPEDNHQESLITLLHTFVDACGAAGLSFDWLAKLYLGKHTLNHFRQDHGYKEGTYCKQWNGREDNEVLIDILKSLSLISGESIYKVLSESYPST